jgi:quinoprotein glucose dehydrogenase
MRFRVELRRATAIHSLIGLTCAVAVAQQDHRTWMNYGGGSDSSHYVALDQIDKSNVSQLQVAWTYPVGDETSYVFNPIVVDNVMYVLARKSSLVALDAATGKELWIHANLPGLTTRGISYWGSKDRKDRRLIFAINNYLEEIDARTGQSILSFGDRGLVNLKEGLGRDPKTIARIQSNTPGRVFEDLIIEGSATGEGYLSPPGDLRAYNVLTGKLVWIFHTVPHPGEFGYDTWPKDAWRYSGGTNTWGEITLDEKRGIAYFPTGSPTYDYYGADRAGDNLFADCLLALNARTGKLLWHFQMVHHDLWDYDATAAPQLITVRHEGKMVDAIAQATKHGFLFVFDRVTGKPLWPVEERKVPQSDMPGEHASPTQPFPTLPPPFARQRMSADDIDPYILTPEERRSWKDRIASLRKQGLFTPPELSETLSLPGARGGSNWGTTAADPSRGLVFLTTQDWPTIYKLSIEDPLGARQNNRRKTSPASPGQDVYDRTCAACHGSNRGAPGNGPPSLGGIDGRFTFDSFRQIVLAGRAEMPAFPNLDNEGLTALYTYLSGPPVSRPNNGASSSGPIVGAGGAPGGLALPPMIGPRYSPLGGPDYPPGLDTPKKRYYTGWGLYPDQPFVIRPPWSSLVAYDLNQGAIKWKVPLGQDPQAAAEGAKDTGIFMAERHGILVTSTGLIFVATSEAKVRAYDEETGKVLWTGALPAGSEGIPALYQVGGREYLVVPASSKLNTGGGHRDKNGALPDQTPPGPRSYVAFALRPVIAR